MSYIQQSNSLYLVYFLSKDHRCQFYIASNNFQEHYTPTLIQIPNKKILLSIVWKRCQVSLKFIQNWLWDNYLVHRLGIMVSTFASWCVWIWARIPVSGNAGNGEHKWRKKRPKMSVGFVNKLKFFFINALKIFCQYWLWALNGIELTWFLWLTNTLRRSSALTLGDITSFGQRRFDMKL